ncbi:extracellular phospholipase C [Dendrothele bispora CBS 962.96]|uniref:Extracellular phospholipase C n=1 Tax=Dendrothele bispora (strain CBS 962.96) TaxID=1314807 RepID=A0A4S8L7S1_DENBC|nr:extracellular phospholipase C [Dendrothele bispora CBS 962.96]
MATLSIYRNLAFVVYLTRLVLADSLADVDHVVLFMQENRAFDHYFGTMAGVRGFRDPNVQINPDGRSTFFQLVDSHLSNATDHLLPFYLNEVGGDFVNGTQCMVAGSNSWGANQAALASGLNNMWAIGNSPYAVGYFKRQDLPVHFAIADAWTVGDMYQEGVIASTDPNRDIWQSGSINIPGGNVNSTQGPVLDNNESPGCSSLTFTTENGTVLRSPKIFSCYPYDWKTVPEYLQDAGISWKSFQAVQNFGDNPLPDFKIYQDLAATNESDPLVQRGLAMSGSGNWQGGLDDFKRDAAAGTLPAVSYYIGPEELSEHQPNLPRDGGWLWKEIVDAVVSSPKYNRTVLVISFDETGGWGDHVVPFHSPENTPGEWIVNPLTGKNTFAGPGFRLPFVVISPWTRGGNVFTEPADHISQILFLEQWAAARGTPFMSAEINDWRREHMSNLTNMFDFDNPDTSPIELPFAEMPHSDLITDLLDGPMNCERLFQGSVQPPIPYGNQTAETSLVTEQGSKSVRGSLTEGRYLVIESGNFALAVDSDNALIAANTSDLKFADASQRFVVHATDPSQATANTFRISAGADFGGNSTTYITAELGFGPVSGGAVFEIVFLRASTGYSFREQTSRKFLSLNGGKVSLTNELEGLKLFSVTF